MKLSIILETVQDQITELANRQSISPEEVTRVTKAINQKQWKYVLNQWHKGNIRLPEDSHRVKETLAQFEKHKSLLVNKDINQYNKLSDIESSINLALGKKEESHIASLNIPGVKIVNQYKNFTTLEITDTEALKDIGEGTKWCTRRSYPDCRASKYLDEYGKIFIVLQDQKPFIQYTPDYDQIMDVNDNEISKDSEGIINQVISKIIPLPDFNIFKEQTDEGEKTLSNYLYKVSNDKNEELEKIIVDKPKYAHTYAYEVIGERWPEAENYIAKDADTAVSYAMVFLKGKRWPLAEQTIINNPREAAKYALNVIKGRWPEAERIIAKDPNAAYQYTEHVLNAKYRNLFTKDEGNNIEKVRFIEAEPYLAKDLYNGYKYAELLMERFPQYEDNVLKELKYIYDRIEKYNLHVFMSDYADLRSTVREYRREILKGREWKEAEDIINKINEKIGMKLY